MSTNTGPKIDKPEKYDGTDTTAAAVKTWIYRVKTYVGSSAAERQTMIAASYLSGTAEQWFITNYADEPTMPTLPVFLDAFQKHFTRSDDRRYLHQAVEAIQQGTQTVTEYSNQFKALVSSLGRKDDDEWAKIHFERGLDSKIQRAVAQNFTEEDTLRTMTQKAQRAAEIILRLKVLNTGAYESRNNSSSSSNSSKFKNQAAVATLLSAAPKPTTAAAAAVRKTLASNTRREKITQPERDYLSAHDGCFFCRKPNVGHTSNNCPELKASEEYKAKKRAEQINALQFSQVDVDAMDVIQDYSKSHKQPKNWPQAPASRPPILIRTKI